MRFLHLLTIGLGITACGGNELDFSEKLILKMEAKYTAPSDATGSFEPSWQEYTLEDVYLTHQDTGENLSLFEGEPVTYRIVDRSQIIFTGDLSEHVGSTFSSLTVTFTGEIKGASKLEENHTLTWGSPTLQSSTPLTVAEAKEETFYISVNWRNTVTRDEEAATESMSLPEITIAANEDE